MRNVGSSGEIVTQQVVRVDGVLQYERFGFTNAVRAGDVLYLSGISALDADGHVLADDIESQTQFTFENIERVLRAGSSSLSNLLQMTSFVVDLQHNGQPYVDMRKRLLTEPTYTSAVIGVSALMIPGLLLEVQCIAAVNQDA
jgi:enamine deaminase RidA (YjgF/YER057c/UK114 family)